MNKGSYIIAKQRTGEDGFRLFLGKVQGQSGNILEGYYEKDCHIKTARKLFEIPKKDVVCDLGPSPHPGKVHGQNVALLYQGRKTEHDFFGTIYLFYAIDKETRQRVMTAFDRAAKILTKWGLQSVENGIWEIQPKEAGGKWAGYYQHSRNPDKMPHRFAFKPAHGTDDQYTYLVLHEFAHYMHANFLTQPRVNAAWIKAFNTSIKPKTVRKEESLQLLDLLLEGQTPPSAFKSELGEENRLSYNWVLKDIKDQHAISVKELDILFEAGDVDEIRSLWPARTIHKKDLKPIVSEYATKSFKELLAESFAFHLTGIKLPTNIVKLLEKSIQMAKSQQEKS